MTNNQQAKMTMYSGIDTFLTDKAAVYAANVAFTKQTALFTTAFDTAVTKSLKTNTDNKGFSVDKDLAKKAMAERTAILAGFARVRFSELGKFDLAGQLSIAVSEYTRVSDSVSSKMAQAALDLMNANIADLTPDYVTAADLTALQTLITAFANTRGSSAMTKQTEPADTAAFKEAIKQCDKTIDDLLILGRFYIATDPDFYNQLLLVAVMPAVNIHHTSLIIQVTDSVTNAPLQGVTASIGDKSAVSDLTGTISIYKIKSGKKQTLLLSKANYNAIETLITIIRSRENNLVMPMVKN